MRRGIKLAIGQPISLPAHPGDVQSHLRVKLHPIPPAGPLLLPTESLVDQTMREVRRVFAWVLAGLALLIGAVVFERTWLQGTHRLAVDRHADALRIAGDLRLQNHRLSTLAQIAVMSGDARGVIRFDEQRPALMQLLEEARALAPEEAIDRFDLLTRTAQDELDDMREAAFEAVSVGEPDVARSIFEGDRYHAHTALLEQAIADFATATVAASRDDLAQVYRRSALLGGGLLAVIVVLGFLLARRLARSRRLFRGAEQRVKSLAASDMLTGLPNRAALHDFMGVALARARRDDRHLALLMIDLDRFKPINDRHGHMAGDVVLREVAQRLSGGLREGELCARFGGDEFVVVLETDANAQSAAATADRLLGPLAEPIAFRGLTLSVGACVGIARFPVDGLSADELLRRADSALYRAKAIGVEGAVCTFDRQLDERVAERAVLEQALREGIAAGEFIGHFQPLVDLATRQVQGVELLARWQHPTRGLLPPSQFIELAEDTGLIGPLMMSLVRRACVEIDRLPASWRVSINIAPQQLRDATLVPQLLSILSAHGLSPTRFDLELTESAVVHDTASARRMMSALRQAGFTVTLDDFGAGYSSLAYLAEFEFDKIKIDRSFVHTLRERPESATVVNAIIGLSRSLGCLTVAEGIETEEDALRLQQMGCTLGQGYLFGRPSPVEAFTPADNRRSGPLPRALPEAGLSLLQAG